MQGEARTPKKAGRSACPQNVPEELGSAKKTVTDHERERLLEGGVPSHPVPPPPDPNCPASLTAYFAEFLDRTKQLMTEHPRKAISICLHAEMTLRALNEFRKTLLPSPKLLPANTQPATGNPPARIADGSTPLTMTNP